MHHQSNDEGEAEASVSEDSNITPAKNGLRIRLMYSQRSCANSPGNDSRVQGVSIRSTKIYAESENHYEEEVYGNAVFDDPGSSKRKRRASDTETPICNECGKTFSSLKAKYGHMRCHSNRPPKRPYVDPSSSVTTKRGLNGTETYDDILAARTLVFMSTDYSQPTGSVRDFVQFKAKMKATDELADQYQNVDGNIKSKKKSNGQTSSNRRYQCRTCNKCFSSHQALGGHTANHNKNKSELEVVKVMEESSKIAAVKHTCEICSLTFPSGQALGGHKRRHWMGAKFIAPPPSPSSHCTSAGEANHGLGDLDLNETIATEEQE